MQSVIYCHCPLLDVGDSFIYEGNSEKPSGFCDSAWLDISRVVTAISNGASYYPWNNAQGQAIWCCGDGTRPVVFEITRVDLDIKEKDI